jgi:large subunit ribosomal protein L32e
MKFIKHDANKLKKIGMSWRKPRGRKNKTKVGKKGHKPLPSKGFRSRTSTRYSIAGKTPVLVYTPSQIERLNGDDVIVIIARTVGSFKRVKILEACKSKNIKVLNYERSAENAEKTGK